MRFIHLSYDPIDKFEPRIPKNRLPGENDSVKRICLSTNIKSAINAKPGWAYPLQVALDRGLDVVLYLYVLETTEDELIPPHILARDYGVIDAEMNQEYWLTHSSCFHEELYLVKNAEFEQEKGWIYPQVRSVKTQRISEIPEFCIQRLVTEINSHLHLGLTTSIFLGELPDIEKKLKSGKLLGKTLRRKLLSQNGGV